MAVQFSGELEARGIGKGERVMLWGENCASGWRRFLGCAVERRGCRSMDDGASGEFAARVARQVEARLWVVRRRHSQHAGKAVPLVVWKIYRGLPRGRRPLLSHPDVIRKGRHPADCFYFGDYGRTQGGGDHAWECVGQHFAAGAGDAALFEV